MFVPFKKEKIAPNSNLSYFLRYFLLSLKSQGISTDLETFWRKFSQIFPYKNRDYYWAISRLLSDDGRHVQLDCFQRFINCFGTDREKLPQKVISIFFKVSIIQSLLWKVIVEMTQKYSSVFHFDLSVGS